jgi:hypothetical protein
MKDFPNRKEIDKLGRACNADKMTDKKFEKHLLLIAKDITKLAREGSCDFTYRLQDEKFTHQDAYDLQYFLLNQSYYCDYNANERTLFISWR